MHESIGEGRPAVDFREELGDSQTWQHRVEAAGDRVDRFVLRSANGTDRQAFFSERGLWQIASGGERVDFPKPSFQTLGLTSRQSSKRSGTARPSSSALR